MSKARVRAALAAQEEPDRSDFAQNRPRSLAERLGHTLTHPEVEAALRLSLQNLWRSDYLCEFCNGLHGVHGNTCIMNTWYEEGEFPCHS